MTQATALDLPESISGPYRKPTLIKGQPAEIECFNIGKQTFTVTRGAVDVISLEEEWYEDLENPEAIVELLRKRPEIKGDLFTFWQRLPDLEPKHRFHTEFEEIAVLPVKSYDHWWNQQIKSRTRNQIRKSEKEGLVVRETVYDDAFVRGMTDIFNEAPVRQGRRFWHYGKDFQTVKEQFSRYTHREWMIGAYYKEQMVGLIMLGNAGCFGLTGQIISSLNHRDKSPNNALVAKAVEICAKNNLAYLSYLNWTADSLSEFKRRCGFEPMKTPRYYIPLTAKGKLALKCGAHRGLKQMLPDGVRHHLKQLRSKFYSSFDR